jgi:hypothetical protein
MFGEFDDDKSGRDFHYLHPLLLLLITFLKINKETGEKIFSLSNNLRHTPILQHQFYLFLFGLKKKIIFFT